SSPAQQELSLSGLPAPASPRTKIQNCPVLVKLTLKSMRGDVLATPPYADHSLLLATGATSMPLPPDMLLSFFSCHESLEPLDDLAWKCSASITTSPLDI